MINLNDSLTISNPSIAFFGKKSDLAVYSSICREFSSEILIDDEPILSYHIFIENSPEITETLKMLLGDTNITSSEGIVLSP
nr:hypothetical protein [uncultured Sphaerochaeta sp.]